MNIKSLKHLIVITVVLASLGSAQDLAATKPADVDYRARTIYFLLADRFNPHQPYGPYVTRNIPSRQTRGIALKSPAQGTMNSAATGAVTSRESSRDWTTWTTSAHLPFGFRL